MAFYFGELEEGRRIVAVLALNTLIGFVTEIKAARSIEALRALGVARPACAATAVRVSFRPSSWCRATSSLLDAGDAVSADLRLVEASNLDADESTLTGESVAVDKRLRPVAADARLADRSSMLFKGTASRAAAASALCATGLATELGGCPSSSKRPNRALAAREEARPALRPARLG